MTRADLHETTPAAETPGDAPPAPAASRFLRGFDRVGVETGDHGRERGEGRFIDGDRL